MRSLVRFSVALAVALAASYSPASAGWGSGVCVAVAAPVAAQVPPPAPALVYHWSDANGGAEAALYLGGVQVGSFRYADRVYMGYNASRDEWDASLTSPPAGAPLLPAMEPASANYGVDTSKIHHGDAYTFGGKSITRDEAIRLVGRPTPKPPAPSPAPGPGPIPDETGKLRVTVIGSAADRAPFVVSYNAPENADVRAHSVLWEVSPDHWTVKEYGFVSTGRPTIYCQAIDADGHGGKVLHRQDDYAAGDRTFEAIRKAIASYDAKRDPDLRRPSLPFPFPILDAEACSNWFNANARMLLASALVVAGAAIHHRRI